MTNERLKALIVDDETMVSKALEYEIKQYFPEVEVVGIARNVKEAMQKIGKYSPDVVFLDIVMPGESGFDLLKNLDKINFELIFVTSHSEYALNAIRVSALAYLLKPVQTDELREALEHVRERKKLKDSSTNYRILLDNMKKESLSEQSIAINNQRETYFARIKDILFCEGWERYTKIHMTGKKQLVSSYNLGKYRAMLEPYSFVQTHRSYLVNPVHVLSATSDDELNMSEGHVVPVAIRKRSEIIAQILSYNK